MRRFAPPLITLLSFAIASFGHPAFADTKEEKYEKRLQDAGAVFKELVTSPDRSVPREMLEHAQCVVVVPHVVKAAIGIGGRAGKGVVACRDANGGWTTPAFVTLSGGSMGFQIGAESTDLVLFFMTERGARSLLAGNQVTLGGKMSVAAGPMGRSAEASTDLKMNAAIYSYAKSKGLFAGISLEGARLNPDDKANRSFYGMTGRQILFEHRAVNAPAAADDFRHVLP